MQQTQPENVTLSTNDSISVGLHMIQRVTQSPNLSYLTLHEGNSQIGSLKKINKWVTVKQRKDNKMAKKINKWVTVKQRTDNKMTKNKKNKK